MTKPQYSKPEYKDNQPIGHDRDPVDDRLPICWAPKLEWPDCKRLEIEWPNPDKSPCSFNGGHNGHIMGDDSR